ncbi:unnamed protein product, partial [Adineta ricciae]
NVPSITQAMYSSTLTHNYEIFSRELYDFSQAYYYEAIQVNVSKNGFYILTGNSSIGLDGFMYKDHFHRFDLLKNLIACNITYQQTTGGAMGSSFTLTLANIFMWNWQKEFVRQHDVTGDLFGSILYKYIDDIFMTWNRSERELRKLLHGASRRHSNIQLDYKIGRSLPFLDVLLTNNNGILSTSVYHKPSAQPDLVPFSFDHHPYVHANVIRTVLGRAIQYSSDMKTFNYENSQIELMLLYNGCVFSS